MRIYIAGPYGAREQLWEIRQDWRDFGFKVTSSWMDEQHEITPGTEGAAMDIDADQVAEHARTDLLEVAESDALVLFTSSYIGCEGGGGRHVETGYALANGREVVVVGAPENIFHRLDHLVTVVPNQQQALAALIRMAARR